MTIVDLEAHRCPNAQIILNRVLTRFSTSQAESLTLISIEPSLERSIKQRIIHLDLPIILERTTQKSISDDLKASWLERFDEEDYEDVCEQQVFSIVKS